MLHTIYHLDSAASSGTSTLQRTVLYLVRGGARLGTIAQTRSIWCEGTYTYFGSVRNRRKPAVKARERVDSACRGCLAGYASEAAKTHEPERFDSVTCSWRSCRVSGLVRSKVDGRLCVCFLFPTRAEMGVRVCRPATRNDSRPTVSRASPSAR